MSPTVRHASIPSAPLQSEPRLSESDRETELLLEHGRRGDRRALDELFGRHTERLRRMVRVRLDPRLRGRVGEADVVQEVYLAALQRLAECTTGKHGGTGSR